MADFEFVKPHSVSQLHENLTKLLKNKKHIESIIVDMTASEIRVDLSKMANAFGNSDFKMKLKGGHAEEARRIIDRLKTQDAPAMSQSQELFDMLDAH